MPGVTLQRKSVVIGDHRRGDRSDHVCIDHQI